jgi:hypothetical protein
MHVCSTAVQRHACMQYGNSETRRHACSMQYAEWQFRGTHVCSMEYGNSEARTHACSTAIQSDACMQFGNSEARMHACMQYLNLPLTTTHHHPPPLPQIFNISRSYEHLHHRSLQRSLRCCHLALPAPSSPPSHPKCPHLTPPSYFHSSPHPFTPPPPIPPLLLPLLSARSFVEPHARPRARAQQVHDRRDRRGGLREVVLVRPPVRPVHGPGWRRLAHPRGLGLGRRLLLRRPRRRHRQH